MAPIWWCAAAAASGYLVAIAMGRKGWYKVLPALSLAALVAPASPLASAAFVACAAGDALLLDKERYFLHGLAAFLVGHLLFVPALLMQRSGEPPPWLVAVIVVAALAVLAAVVPKLRGKLAIAVPVYALALAAMGIAAGAHGPVAGAGALLFVVSDGLLAINRFARPLPRAELLILATYFSALLTLAAGIVGAA